MDDCLGDWLFEPVSFVVDADRDPDRPGPAVRVREVAQIATGAVVAGLDGELGPDPFFAIRHG